ncbi:MAG: Ribosome-binding factor A [uncultured Aureispira sp.]|uniref:Ribosome-binding factor A n=1 Tax=uncultured Aureispira sp. TaxID=1331704 RepID=A0A6S6TZR1_9BACT|nr:MAG: Ribosome-binding factor A [uncultured Aureispira sp.]
MEQTKKQRQVSSLIQHEFSTILQSEGAFIYGVDPLVTVTNVKMSSDLGIAYIYVSVYNVPYKQEVVKELWENLSYLRGLVGKRIRKQVRRIPILKFYIDDTLDEVEHIDNLFTRMHAESNTQNRSMKEAMDAKKTLEELSKDEEE